MEGRVTQFRIETSLYLFAELILSGIRIGECHYIGEHNRIHKTIAMRGSL